MEACAAAQVCLRAGVPFQTLKVVSDHLFSDRQDAEYAGNFEDAMACLDGAVKTYLELMED